MKRLISVSLALAAVACTKDKPGIQLFAAAPGAITAGQSAQLIFAASAGSALSIDNGVGDVTGKTSVTVTPAANTTYTLTATRNGSSVTASASVAVGPAPALGFAVSRSGGANAVAGVAGAFTVSAVDSTGALVTAYRGTVHLKTDDAQAALPADYTFTAADAGKHAFTLTFKTAGARILVAADAQATATQGVLQFNLDPGAPSQLVLAGLPAAAVAGDLLSASVTALDAYGNTTPGYAGTVHFTSADAGATLPADTAFTAADKGKRAFAVSLVTAGPITVTVADKAAAALTAQASVAVRPGPPAGVSLSGLAAEVKVDDSLIAIATVQDAFRNTVKDYAGTLHFVLTDAAAPAIADVTFTPANLGKAQIAFTFFTAGQQSLQASDAAHAGVSGSTALRVDPGSVSAYTLSPLPAAAMAGEPLPLVVRAVDAHGNLASSYAGAGHFTSTGPSDQLPADGAFAQGVRTVSFAFHLVGPNVVTVKEVGGAITGHSSTVAVSPGDAASIALQGDSGAAGVPINLTATILDLYQNVATQYRGTVGFLTDDPSNRRPPPVQFQAGDAAGKVIPLTFRTAGLLKILAVDTVTGSIYGFTLVSVAPAAASRCLITELPVAAAAGAQLSARVAVTDAYGNRATGYTGTVALSSDDGRASLSPPVQFVAGDAGQRIFQAQLVSAGARRLIAADDSERFTCSWSIQVTPGATLFAITLPGDTNAGAPAAATVQAQDSYGNLISGFAGTITFANSDSAGTTPADVTLAGTEGGTANVSATFNSLGFQSLTATQVGSAGVSGSGFTNVHGFVYTNPVVPGRVQLLLNNASTGALVQLDLVANTTLFAQPSQFDPSVPARDGAFAAGMNLPLDNTQVAAPDSGIFVLGNALDLGQPPYAAAAALPASGPGVGLLLSGASQKRAGNGANPNDSSISVGGIFYSLQLALPPTAQQGVIFDGQALGPKFRAAVRDRSGSDIISQGDFAIGKLEIR